MPCCNFPNSLVSRKNGEITNLRINCFTHLLSTKVVFRVEEGSPKSIEMDSKTESIKSGHHSAESHSEKVPEVSATTVTGDELARNPLLDPKVAEHYREVYEEARYECRYVFDPALEWNPKEEKKIVRKLDLHVTTWACVV